MRRGDILLMNYKFDPIGYYIKRITHSQWNHVAFAIDNKRVVESRGNKITISNIKTRTNKFLYKTKLVRPKLKDRQLSKAVDYAVMQVGDGNYFKFLYTLFLLKLKVTNNPPHKPCSGFIAEVLDVVGFRFCNHKKPLLITPEDIASSEKVQNVEE